LVTPAAFVAAGVLLVASAVNSGGTDIRAERYGDLADLARQETDRVRDLRAEVRSLQGDVEELSEGVDSGALAALQRQVEGLEAPAGLTAVSGPGLTITLEDAPEEIRESAGDQVSNAIVHQQDIQAVVNALWAGGAEAMTLQGQRVISTTGIKCVGNTVLLHGVTYSPPYVISAIGDPDELRSSVDRNPYIAAYRQAVDQWQLGWELEEEGEIEAPAFNGSVELEHAQPADG
jgi:uncharacterized protein YlxW (UPF0749 family)